MTALYLSLTWSEALGLSTVVFVYFYFGPIKLCSVTPAAARELHPSHSQTHRVLQPGGENGAFGCKQPKGHSGCRGCFLPASHQGSACQVRGGGDAPEPSPSNGRV